MNRNETILIVDDEPNIRLGFRTALTTAGYTVDEAETGSDALDMLACAARDLVLLDLQLPGLGGMEVLRRLRLAGNELFVVIFTAHGTVPDAVAAMKLGAVDVLSKPLAPTELRRVVGGVLARYAVPADEPRPGALRLRHPTTVTVGPAVVDLTAAKRALNRREFGRANDLLEEALDLVPDSAEALTLMGELRESCGEDHAAYHFYKAALKNAAQYGPALNNMRRYCARSGLDHCNKTINPGAR